MKNEEFLELITRIADGEATDEEIYRYNAWCNSLQVAGEPIPDLKEIEARMLTHVNEQIDSNHTSRLKVMARLVAAASVIICMGIGGYYLLRYKQPAPQVVQLQTNDIAPGGNKAILTLSGGKIIVLNDAKVGQLASQGSAAITKTADGEVVYNTNKRHTTTEIAYNTITTPRGGQWQLTLPDGTRVWLNATSSITFPTAFTSNNRTVKITGEAYFEVTHNPAKPFKVMVKDQTVEVLGTHFNINAYDDEPTINTTLLEGKVEVSKGKNTVYLNPGQQAVNTGNTIKVNETDTELTIAWKNGYFQFDKADLQTVMRQLARWYDADIAYEGNIPRRVFSGKMHRNLNASESLEMLKYFRVNYKLEGKKIIIIP